MDSRLNRRNKAATVFKFQISPLQLESLGERNGETCKRWHVQENVQAVEHKCGQTLMEKRLTAGKRGKTCRQSSTSVAKRSWKND